MSLLERTSLHSEMKALVDKAESAGRVMTAAEGARFNEIAAAIGRLDNNTITARAKVADYADRFDIPRTPFDDNEARAYFLSFLRTGKIHNSIRAAQTTGSTAGGGALIPQLFFRTLTAIMRQYDRLFDPDVVQVVETDTGAPLPFPEIDDVSNAAAIVAENVISTKGPDLTFAQVQMPQCPTWRSGWFTIPRQLLQDSAFPIENLVIEAAGKRFARGIGASVVSTLQSSALTGSTTTSGQTTTVIVDDLYNLMGSVNPAYLVSPKCGWAMSFSTLIALLKVKDTTGRPILPVVHDDKGNILLLEKPVYICPSMPSPAAGATPIAFGDFSRLILRFVKDSGAMIRATEFPGIAENYCVAFQGYLRAEAAMLLDTNQSPADSPIKLLANATS